MRTELSRLFCSGFRTPGREVWIASAGAPPKPVLLGWEIWNSHLPKAARTGHHQVSPFAHNPWARHPPHGGTKRALQASMPAFGVAATMETGDYHNQCSYVVVPCPRLSQLCVGFRYPGDRKGHGFLNRLALTCSQGMTSEGFFS
jgi:hypothetical protein